MKTTTWGALWLVLYVLCAALSIVPEFGTGGKILCAIAGLCFFVPAGVLLWRGKKTGSRKLVNLVRYLSLSSLVLTTATLVCIFVSVNGTAQMGHVLQGILVLVSAPMLCMPAWVLSLFLWASLFFASFISRKQK